MTTFEEACRVKNIVAKNLMAGFNDASRARVNSVGVSLDSEGHFVSVGLEGAPTPEQSKQLPADCDGVRIKYKVIGKITAL